MGDGLVALFIDCENLIISAQEQFNEPVQWQKILRFAERWGRVIIRRAYADWSVYNQHQKELIALGIELVHTNGRGKSTADIRIAIDAVSIVASKDLPLTHIVLCSGDGDFTELVHYLRRQGKFVIGLGVRASSASSLITSCDEFVYYDDLIKALPAQVEEKAVDRYIKALSSKVRMTASRYRPWIILDFYKLMRQNPGLSLNELREKLLEYYQKNRPEIPASTVSEVIHQLFHTYCFEFTPPWREKGPDLWDRPASLKEGIHSAAQLLKHCDLGLLQILSRNLGESIDPATAAELLYGRGDNAKLIEYVQSLINEINLPG